jgi:hypothetical protein
MPERAAGAAAMTALEERLILNFKMGAWMPWRFLISGPP